MQKGHVSGRSVREGDGIKARDKNNCVGGLGQDVRSFYVVDRFTLFMLQVAFVQILLWYNQISLKFLSLTWP